MLQDLTYDTFEKHLNQTFQVKSEAAAVKAELIECRKLPPAHSRSREPFSILFRGPAEPVLPQQVYQVENDAAGAVEIFLVPIGPGEDGGMLYEAVFA